MLPTDSSHRHRHSLLELENTNSRLYITFRLQARRVVETRLGSLRYIQYSTSIGFGDTVRTSTRTPNVFPRRKCARFSLVHVDSHLHRRGLRRPLILCLLHSPLPATRPLCDCFRFTQLSHHIRSPHFRPIIARCGHLIVSLTTYLFVSYRIQSNRYIFRSPFSSPSL